MGRGLLLSVFVLAGLLVGCGAKPRAIAQNGQLPSPSPTPPGACMFPLQASLTVTTPASQILVGTPVNFRLEAQRCVGDKFKIQGAPSSDFFDSIKTFSKSYASAQVVTENLVLEVWNAAGAVAETRALSVVFTVTGSGSGALGCQIDRVPGRVITQANDPIYVAITVTGGPTQIQLNGATVAAGTPVAVNPVAPNSGTYDTNGQVTLGASTVTCTKKFLTPLCQHRIISTDTSGNPPKITLASETLLGGTIMQVEVNGQFTTNLPVLPNNVLSFTNNNLPFESGVLTSTAKAYAPFGDTVSCSANYTARFPLAQVLNSPNSYAPFSGSMGTSYQAFVGFGASGMGSGQWTYRTASYFAPVREPNAVSKIGVCGADEIIVGKPQWLDYNLGLPFILCAPVSPGLSLRNSSLAIIPWLPNMFASCPTGKVMTGMLFDGAFLTLTCSEIYQP